MRDSLLRSDIPFFFQNISHSDFRFLLRDKNEIMEGRYLGELKSDRHGVPGMILRKARKTNQKMGRALRQAHSYLLS